MLSHHGHARAGYVAPEPGLDSVWRQMLAYDQTRLHVVVTEHSYTNAQIGTDSRRTPEPSEVIVAELTGFAPASSRAGITNLFTPVELDAAWHRLGRNPRRPLRAGFRC